MGFRLQVVEPGNLKLEEAYPLIGDIEREVYDTLVDLRCTPFLLSYMKARPCFEPQAFQKAPFSSADGCKRLSTQLLCKAVQITFAKSPDRLVQCLAGLLVHTAHVIAWQYRLWQLCQIPVPLVNHLGKAH